MGRSKSNGAVGAVMIAGVVIAVLSFVQPVAGYIVIVTTGLLGAIAVWGRVRGEAEGGVGLPLLLAGLVIAFASCGISLKRVGEKERRHVALQVRAQDQHRRQASQEAAAENRSAELNKRQEAEPQLQKRNELIQAELERPLSERAVEAKTSLEKAEGREEVARAICYGDTLLDGAETSSEIKSLRKARDRAAKEVTSEYQAELSTDRGLLCRDGSVSPTCSCGGSHRGCCSHHGGVAGCEPKPKVEIDCEGAPAQHWLEHHLAAVGRPLPPLLDAPAGEREVSPLRVHR
jgi:hypothetical protein